MAAFWRDLVLTAMHNMTATLGAVMPSILAMLTLVALGALLGWVAAARVGWLAANFVAQAVLVAGVNAGLLRARLLARSARWLILLFVFATALTEIGIGRDMVLIAFGVLFGGLVLALALAFGLGGRHLAREILERGQRREREPAGHDGITHL